MGAGCSGINLFYPKLMDKCTPKNGCFFIYFVIFISTLVYSVFWIQYIASVRQVFLEVI